MWRWLLVGVGSLLVIGCGSDFIAEEPPDPDVRSKTDTGVDVPSYPDTGQPHTDPCGKRPKGDGCVCSYLNKREGVCQPAYIKDGKCQKPEGFEKDETSCDYKDNDCDGEVDEGCTREYLCRDDNCVIDKIESDEDRVYFHMTCGDVDHLRSMPRCTEDDDYCSAKKEGECWRVSCWVGNKRVYEKWCNQSGGI